MLFDISVSFDVIFLGLLSSLQTKGTSPLRSIRLWIYSPWLTKTVYFMLSTVLLKCCFTERVTGICFRFAVVKVY